jgi:hypothetical protein
VHTQLRYDGFRKTPPLWQQSVLEAYRQIELPAGESDLPEGFSDQPLRLGKLVETYVYHLLQSRKTIEWIADGLQIQNGLQTIGELDALYIDGAQAVHLEVAYKFYLYDTRQQYDDPLNYWIGPNRNDSLSLKLHKLEHKQFPLLFAPETLVLLRELGLDVTRMEQRLCCQGQLFVPYDQRNLKVAPLNQACVAGFHLPFFGVERFADHQFFIPGKLDWLVEPHLQVGWLSFAEARKELAPIINAGRSPMLWLRSAAGDLSKCFVTCW